MARTGGIIRTHCNTIEGCVVRLPVVLLEDLEALVCSRADDGELVDVIAHVLHMLSHHIYPRDDILDEGSQGGRDCKCCLEKCLREEVLINEHSIEWEWALTVRSSYNCSRIGQSSSSMMKWHSRTPCALLNSALSHTLNRMGRSSSAHSRTMVTVFQRVWTA